MIELQYTEKESFYHLHNEIGKFNITEYYKFFDTNLKNKTILDIGCGEGNDLNYFKNQNAKIYGIDTNYEAIRVAQNKFLLNETYLQCNKAEDIKFEKESFDIVGSNYVLQGIADIESVYKEVNRVLKPNGTFIFLVTHPMRQYFEKKDVSANYFEQKIVNSVILNNTVTVQEPTHTMNDYLSEYFLENFQIEKFIELNDPTAEKVENRNYPGFFILKARKK